RTSAAGICSRRSSRIRSAIAATAASSPHRSPSAQSEAGKPFQPLLPFPMTRVISGGVLIALAVYVVWFAPRLAFFAVAELLLLLAFVEYARLAEAAGI